MACNLDHTGLNAKFCPSCGEKIVAESYACVNNHPMKKSQKFCASCGETAKISRTKEEEPLLVEKENNYLNIDYNLGTQSTSTNTNNVASESNRQDFSDFHALPINEPKKNTLSSNSVIAICVGALIFVVILIAGSSSSSSPVTMTVEMTVSGQDCFDLSWGYGDIPNGQVIVTVDGESAGFGTYSALGSSTGFGCKFTAYVSDVPSDGESYSVSMASGRRGTIYNTRAELEANDWTFSLSLG